MCGQHHVIQGVDMQHYNAFDEWLLASTALGGASQSYIEELYESYLEDPSSVDESWRATFDALPKQPPQSNHIHQCVIISVV